jgi:glycerol-3-phosphate O-acyltransferase
MFFFSNAIIHGFVFVQAKERRKAINQRFVEGKARIREDSTHDAEKLHEKQKLYRLAKQELALILRRDDATQDLESGLAGSSIDKPVTNSELLHDAQQTHHKTTTMLQSGLRDLLESQQVCVQVFFLMCREECFFFSKNFGIVVFFFWFYERLDKPPCSN